MTDQVIVNVNNLPTPSIFVLGDEEICGDNAPIQMFVTGGIFSTVEWYLNDIILVGVGNTFNAYESGNYTAIVTDNNGCTNSSAPVTLTIHKNPEPTLIAEGNGTFCDGFDIDLTATFGFNNYIFTLVGSGIVQNGSNNIFEATQSGQYAVTVTDDNGCMGTSDTISVSVDALPMPIIQGVPSDTLCNNECTQLYVEGFYQQVTWYQGNPNDLNNATILGNGNPFDICETGNYFVQVFDESTGQTCEGYSPMINIFKEESFSIEIVSNNLNVCEYNLPIVLTATLYNNVTYNWYQNGSTLVQSSNSNIFNASISADYYVEIITPNGCSYQSEGVSTIVDQVPFVDAGLNQTICIGEEVELNINSDYSITDISILLGDINDIPSCTDCNNPIVSPNQTTTYLVTVTTEEGCIMTDQVTVTVNLLPQPIIFSFQTEECKSQAPISLLALGGTFNSIEWYKDGITLVGTGNTFDAYESGDYTIIVTDNNGCINTSEIKTITINENPQPELIVEGNGTFCDGFDIDLTATDGFNNYSFEMLGIGIVQNGANNIFEATQTGQYAVTVTDVNGCVGTSDTITVTIDALPNPIVEGIPGDTLCYGQCANLYVVGIYQSVIWYQGNPNNLNNAIEVGAGNNFQTCQTGTYFVHVIDEAAGQNCEGYSLPIDVFVESPVNINLTVDALEKCENDAPIVITAPIYDNATYHWYFNGTELVQSSNSNIYNANESGTYNVEVITSEGCTNISDGITVTIHSMPFIEAGSNQTICIGETIGIDIDSDLGITNISPISGDINAIPSCSNCNNPEMSPTTTTEYEVTAISEFGCISKDTIIIQVNPLPSPIIINNGDNEICKSEGPIILTASGGTFTSIEWYKNGITLMGVGTDFEVYESGDYSITVIDSNGCSNTSEIINITINDNPIPELISEGNGTFCEGFDIDLIATTGFNNYTFELSGSGVVQNGSNHIFEATLSGTYIVTVTDENNCIGTSSPITVTLDIAPQPIIQGVPNNILCSGECTQLYVEGFYQQVTWYQGNPNDLINATILGNGNPFDICETGTYFVHVFDESTGQTCEGYSPVINIEVEDLVEVKITTDQAEKCEEETPIFLTATSLLNATYNWYLNGSELVQSSNNNTFAAYESGIYSVEVMTNNECLNTANGVNITVHPMPFVDAGFNQTICEGEEAELNINSDTPVINITAINGDISDIPSCLNCTNPIVSPSQTTTYEVVVMTEAGCRKSDLVTVNVNSLPEPNIVVTGSTEICASDAPISLTVIGGSFTNIEWYLNGITLVGNETTLETSQSGNYTVYVTDINGCSNQSASIEITVHENPNPTLVAEGNNTFCEGGNISLSTDSGYDNYIFEMIGNGIVQNSNSNIFTATQSGSYIVNVQDNFGCIGTSDTIQVSIDPLPNPIIEGVPNDILCNNECTDLYVIGIYQSVIWYQGQLNDLENAIEVGAGNNFTVCESGSYFVYVLDEAAGQNCEGYSMSVNINFEENINVVIDASSLATCQIDAPITLTVPTTNTNTIYNWYLNGSDLVQSSNTNIYNANESGTYTVELISDNGCSYTSEGVSIQIHSMPLLDTGTNPTICKGDGIELNLVSNANITDIIPISGDLNADANCTCNNPTVNPSSTTTYAVTVTNIEGCSITEQITVFVEDLPSPSIEAENGTNICSNDAPIILNTTGGDFETYDWYLNNITLVGTGVSFEASESGSYTVNVTDKNGCSQISQAIDITIYENPTPSLIATGNNTFCEDGNITLTATSGYNNYTFELIGTGIIQDSNSNTFIATQSGDYTVQITDQFGCTGHSEIISVSIDPSPNPIIMGVPIQPLCINECANLYTTGVYQEITWYQGNPNDLENAITMTSGNDFEVCESGSYFVHVIDEADGQNCEGYSLPIIIELANPISLEIVPDALSKCATDAPIILNASNYLNMTYNWYLNGGDLVQSSTSNIYTASTSGTYTVEVVDAQGCTYSSEGVTINIHTIPTIDAGNNKTICLGEAIELSLITNANITNVIPISGDLSDIPDCFNCNNPVVSPTISTTYEITVENDFGCTNTAWVSINVNSPPTPYINVIDDNSEVCANNAPILLEATGGLFTNIEWYLDDFTLVGTGNTLQVNQSGNYSIFVTDENGCNNTSSSVRITIHETPIPELNVTGNGTFCEGFDIELTANEGFIHYVFELLGTGIVQNSSSNTFIATTSGEYLVTVLDQNGCEGMSESISISVDALPIPSIEGVPSQSLCSDNCQTLYVLGSYQQITWYNGNSNDIENATIVGAGASFEVCESGNYFVFVLDEAEGQTCEGYSESVNIEIDAPIEIVIEGQNIETCETDLPIVLTATSLPNVTYNWYLNNTSLIQSGSSNTININQTGSYSVEVRNEKGCSTISNGIDVDIHSTPTIDAGNNMEICLGESTQLSIITNATITQITPINGDTEAIASCNDCNNPTVSPTSTTTYEVIVSNEWGCTNSSQVQVIINELIAPDIEVGGGTNSICLDDAPIILSIDGNNYSEIEWYKDEITLVGTNENFNAFESGFYTVVVTDVNGCVNTSSSVEINIETNPIPELTVTGNGSFCDGSAVEFVATDGYDSYEWYLVNGDLQATTTNNIFTVNSDGQYYVIAYNNNCMGTSDTVNISTNDLPNPQITVIGDTSICEDESVQLAIVGDYTNIQWYGDYGSGMVPIIGANTTVYETSLAGTYQVFVSDGNDCEGYSNEQTIEIYNSESIIILQGDITACSEELPITLTATEGFSQYTWTRNGTTILQEGSSNTLVIDLAGDYKVSAINNNGCNINSQGINVELTGSPLVDIITRPYQLCEGEEGIFEAAPLLANHTISWSISDGNNNPIILNGEGPHNTSFDNAGFYQVEVIVNNQITSCQLIQNYTFEVYELPQPQITASTEPIICEGEAVNLQVTGNSFISQQWYFEGTPIFDANNNNIFATENGIYSVVVENQQGCQVEINTQVTVIDLPTFELSTITNGTFCEGLNTNIIVEPAGYDNYEFVHLNTGATIQSSNANILTVTQAGNYAISVTNDGCTSEHQFIELNTNPTPQPTIYTNNGNESCANECITLFIAGNYINITWYEGNPNDLSNATTVGAGNNFDACTSGNYFAYVYDNANCEGYSDIFEVNIFEEIEVNLNASATNVCFDDLPVILTTNEIENAQYTWLLNGSPQPSDNTHTFNACMTGLYSVIIESTEGCQSTSNLVSIHVPSTPFVDAGNNQDICMGESTQIHINSSTEITSITPINGDTNATASCLCNNPTVTPNETTTYEVIVTTVDGCTASDLVTVQIHQENNLSIETNNDGTCEGDIATLTAIPNIYQQYSWYNESGILLQTGTNNTFESSESGTFTVIALDENNCSVQTNAMLTINSIPNVELALQGSSSFCDGGMMTLQATEGMTHYDWYFNYVLIESNGNSNYTATMDGIYHVIVTDENGCTNESNPIIVSVLSNPQPIIITNNDLSLCDGEEATLCVAQTYAAYHWYNVNDTMNLLSTDQCFTPTESGTYFVDVRDNEGCMGISQSISVSYESLENPVVGPLNPSPQCGGIIELHITVEEGINYEWYYYGLPTGITTSTFQAQNTGTYMVVATNAAGCEASSDLIEVVINESPELFLASQGSTELCNGESVFLYTTGNIFDSYQWFNENGPIINATEVNFTTNETGTYYVVAANEDGCESISNEITVSQNEGITPSINAEGNTTICEGASINLTTDTDYTNYQWFYNGIPIYQANQANFLATQTGDYFVSVTNETGCQGISNSITLTTLTPPTPNITLDGPSTFCEAGEVSLSVNEEFNNYQWFNENGIIIGATNSTFIPSSSGTYNVEVSNEIGCLGISESISISISESAAPSVSVFGNTDVCEGEEVTLFALGTYNTILWYEAQNPDTPIFAGPSLVVDESGEYFIQVSDNTGCSGTSETVSVNILSIESPTIFIENNSIICEGESAILSINDEYENYQWLLYGNEILGANDPTLEVNLPGLYSISVGNEIECTTISNPIDILINPTPEISIQAIGNTNICEGESLLLEANADDGNITWFETENSTLPIGTGNSLTVNQAGSYFAQITNEYNCTQFSESINVSILESETPNIVSSTENNNLCENEEIILSVDGDFTDYQWFINNNEITGANQAIYTIEQEGIYTLSITNQNGCSYLSNPIEIGSGEMPSVEITMQGSSQLCEGESTTLIAANNYDSYQWLLNGNPINNATQSILTVSETGIYSLLVENQNGCSTTSENMEIIVSNTLTIEIGIQGNTQLCEGESTTLVAANNFDNYQWLLNGSPIDNATQSSLIISEAGIYSLLVENQNGCTATSNNIEVSVSESLTVSISPQSDTQLCEGESTSLIALGEFDSYQWLINGNPIANANQQTLTTSEEGVYSLFVESQSGCTATSNTIGVTVEETLTIEISTQGNTQLCEGESTILVAPSGFNTYQWFNNGDPIDNATNEALEVNTTGNYTVQISNDNDCTATANEITINVLTNENSNFAIEANGNTNLCNGENVVLNSNIQSNDIIWYNADSNLPIHEGNSFTVNNAGTFYAIINLNNVCETTSNEITITFSDCIESDISLSKMVNTNLVETGDTIVYTLIATNEGSGIISGIKVEDILPEGIAFINTLNNNINNYDPITGIWNVGSLAEEQSATLEIMARVTAEEGSITNYAQVIEMTQDDIDSNPNNGNPNNELSEWEDDEAQVMISLNNPTTPVADLTLFKLANVSTVTTGDTIVYTLTLLNNGPDNANNVQVLDLLQEGLMFINASADNYDPITGIWYIDQVTNGFGQILQITAVVTATQGENIYNFAQVISSDTVDPDSTPNNGNPNNVNDLEDDEALVTIPLDLPEMADLEFNKSVNNTTPMLGDTITYTLSIHNNGPDNATGVEVIDNLPEGLTFVTSNLNTFNPATGVWNIETLLVGQTLNLYIDVIVSATSGNIQNFAEVISTDQVDPNSEPSNGDPDQDPDNWEDDEDKANIIVNTPAFIDLSLDKTVNVNSIESGEVITYTLTVINSGNTTATNVAVKDSLADGLSFVSASPNLYDPITGIWEVGNLIPGESSTLFLNAEVTATEGIILNYAQVTNADQEDTDSSPNNGDLKEDESTWEDDEDAVLVEVLGQQANSCEGFLAIENVICSDDHLSYQVILSMQGSNEGYTILDNQTGLTINTLQPNQIFGPFENEAPYSYTITSNDNPECNITLEQSLVDCVVTSIELLTFRGEAQAQGNLLWWTTASQVENDYFELMRSTNGKDFEAIAKIEGAGSSNVIEEYDFLDKDAPSGMSYYRLDYTDTEGKTGSSEIIVLQRGNLPFDVSLMPNPAQDIINIAIASSLPQNVEMLIFDMAGKLIRYQKLENIQAEILELNIQDWADGVYLIQFVNKGENLYQQRFIKH